MNVASIFYPSRPLACPLPLAWLYCTPIVRTSQLSK
uniref:Uncharacterized protein n=1 Tax=Phage sp. ctcqm2 TaxID=2828007 RepID=A0A8S5ST62_9VIRU|nr:MAG TPA: hypothetical protein [Phage sp. ctcqm2]